MIEHVIIQYLTPYVARWGYALAFILTFLEASLFLGIVLPGETAVVAAGVFTAQGTLSIYVLIAVVIVGAIAGDSVGYALGKRYGEPFFLKYGKYVFLKKERYDEAREFFQEQGGRAVFIGRFIAGFRSVIPFVAGAARLSYKRFLLANISGGILWSIVFSVIGYLVGKGWMQIQSYVGTAGIIIFIVTVFAIYGYFVSIERRRLLKKNKN
jgi:membrane-associated protein